MADEPFPLEQFLGGKIASQTQAVAGMKAAEEEQARRFDAAKESQAALSDAVAPLQKSLADQLGAGLQETGAALQNFDQQFGERPVAMPEPLKEEERIFPGSVGVTRVPPYDYRWTWIAQDGSPRSAAVSADNNNGQLGVDIATRNLAHVWCANGVGVFYRPVYNGYLHVWANPPFSYDWETVCWFATAHSDGWLGLYVGQFTLAGILDWVPVSQHIFQWRQDGFLGTTGSLGRNPPYPLSAFFPVNTAHWYGIWVWSGGSIYGDGMNVAWGSSAWSRLNFVVPSISMALY
jgi:hypothetical protein